LQAFGVGRHQLQVDKITKGGGLLPESAKFLTGPEGG
jgi:hypothetical protein